MFSYKDTVNNINTYVTITYKTGISSSNCANSKYLNHHHEYIITGDLRIIQNQTIIRFISKGLNYRKPKTRNWKTSKESLVVTLDNLIKGKLSADKKRCLQNL